MPDRETWSYSHSTQVLRPTLSPVNVRDNWAFGQYSLAPVGLSQRVDGNPWFDATGSVPRFRNVWLHVAQRHR